MDAVLERPSEKEKQIAQSSLKALGDIVERLSARESFELLLDGHKDNGHVRIEVPKRILGLLIEILTNMSKGIPFSLIPSETELTTQQAADFLKVSRPHLIKLLKAQEIPFKKVGSHRRILLEDIIEYSNRFKVEREKALEFLAQQAQDFNMGY